MITYCHGQTSGDFQQGDIIFLAGNPQHPDPPTFEHVAIVAEDKRARSYSDVLKIRVYGLPESLGTASSFGTVETYEDAYLPKGGRLRRHGHPESGWNLAGRPGIGRVAAEQLIQGAARELGRGVFLFRKEYFAIEETGSFRECNCLGFVCDIYQRYSGRQLLHPKFPSYSPSFASEPGKPPEKRNHPAPGHLAEALDQSEFPFGEGIDRAKAEAYLAGKVPACWQNGRLMPHLHVRRPLLTQNQKANSGGITRMHSAARG